MMLRFMLTVSPFHYLLFSRARKATTVVVDLTRTIPVNAGRSRASHGAGGSQV